MKGLDKVSVIIPTYNGAKYINRAVQSVLDQDYPDFEVIIVDNSSKPEPMNLPFDNRIRLIFSDVIGDVIHATNMGIKYAEGEYIAILDDDDYWLNTDKLTTQVAVMKAWHGRVLVGTNAVYVDEEGRELYEVVMPGTDYKIRQSMLANNNFIHSSVLYCKDAIIKAGGYQTRKAVDYLPMLNLGLQGGMCNLQRFDTAHTIRQRGFKMLYRRHITLHLHQIRLIGKYKNDYPNYRKALVKRWYQYLGLMIEIVVTIPPVSYLKAWLMKNHRLWTVILKARNRVFA